MRIQSPEAKLAAALRNGEVEWQQRFSRSIGRAMTEERRRFRMSLARKLSLLTGAVIALCLLIVLAIAYEVLTRSALGRAAETLTRATRQLASLGETGIRASRSR